MLNYAEIHYRPRFTPSLLYSRRPEILFDAPSRIDPGRPLPLFLIIKDAHRFPVKLESVNVRMVYEDGADRVAAFPYEGDIVDTMIWWDSINIIPDKSGYVTIDPYLVLRDGRRMRLVHVDNYRATLHEPLHVYVSPEPLPGGDHWFHGDAHCHSFFTSDQVEFGAPAEALTHAARCMGLDWLAVTDHSYDLDDRADDYTAEDPSLGKWHELHRLSAGTDSDITVIPGEEVSCRNAEGRNCHLLAIDADNFIRGSGDSGERGLANHSELSIGEVAAACMDSGGLACAAHPRERVPWTEKAVLNRGQWSELDLETPGISALQVFNGEHDTGFYDGIAQWVRLLLGGRKLVLLGGSDSHGDMNRQRHIGVPLLTMKERRIHLFGATRTVVRAASAARGDIVRGIAEGRTVITEGPFIGLTATAGGQSEGPGGTLPAGTATISASFRSSREFGALQSVRILAGFHGETTEREIHSPVIRGGAYTHECGFEADLSHARYLRAECVTVPDRYCMTNPVWITGRRSG